MLDEILDRIRWARVTRKMQAYRSLQQAKGFETVMADLAAFCHYRKPTTRISPVTASVDPIAMAQTEGRREVYLRIIEMMDLEDSKIRAMMRDEFETEQRLMKQEEAYA